MRTVCNVRAPSHTLLHVKHLDRNIRKQLHYTKRNKSQLAPILHKRNHKGFFTFSYKDESNTHSSGKCT